MFKCFSDTSRRIVAGDSDLFRPMQALASILAVFAHLKEQELLRRA